MSKFVDERVVEMSFDNKRFESNVKTSMGTIDKLKNSLDFSGTANSINGQLNGINTGGLSTAIMNAKMSFTAFEIATISAIANITNRVIDLGIQMVKSLSTDQIAAGWSKFGQTAISEATLLAQGFSQEEVTETLEKLLWYSDETSYSFTDMVDNMSKFTASGQGLQESSTAMMGIANWAALSGQNAQVASRAMYQLSQAMATGSIRLMDYKSIQNANMDTKEFRETVLSTAVAMGQLIQNVDGSYTTLTGKDFNIGQFTMELDELWFTSEVLMKSLEKYSSGSEKLYEKIAEDSSINTASQAIEKYGDQLNEFELKAFLAAQEARTFKDAIVAVKDAVASGWMNIFTQIFGSVAEAKVLWSDLANSLYDVFMDGMWTKIDILGIWADNGGRNDLFENTEENTGAFWNLFNALVAIKDLIGDAWQKVFGFGDQINDIATKLKTFTENLKEWSEGLLMSSETTEVLTNILTGLFSILKIVGKTVIAVAKGFSPLIEVLKPALGYLLGALGMVGKKITEFAESTTIFDTITRNIQNLFSWFGKVNMKPVDEFNEDVEEKFSPLKTFIEGLGNLFKGLWGVAKLIIPALGALFTFLGKILTTVSDKIKSVFTDDTGKIDFEKIFTVGFWAVVVVGIYRFADMLRSIVTVFRDAFDSIFDYFNSKAMMQYMEAIKTMAISILLMVGALLILGTMDTDVLKKSMYALGALMTFMVGVLLLMKNLAAFEIKGSLKDMLFKGSDMAAIGRAFAGIAIAILLLSYSLKMISGLDPNQMMYSLVAIATMMAMMIGFMKLAGQSEKGINKSVKGTNKAIRGMLTMAIALTLLIIPLKVIGAIPWIKLLSSLGALSLVMLTLIGLSKILSLAKVNTFSLFGISVSLIVLSNGLLLFSAAMLALGSIPFTKLAIGVGAMVATLVLLAVVARVLTARAILAIFGISVSLIVLSNGLLLFSAAMLALGSIPFRTLAIGLGVIVATLVLLGLAAWALTASGAILAILGLAISFAVFAVSIFLLATALTMLIGVMTVSAAAFAAGMIAISNAIIIAAPTIMEALWEIVEGILSIVIKSIPLVVEALTMLILEILKAIETIFPTIINTLVTLFLQLLDALITNIPIFVDKMVELLVTFFRSLRARLPEVMIELALLIADLVDGAVAAIVLLVPRLVNAGFNLIIGLLDGIGIAVKKRAPELRKSINRFWKNIWEAIFSFFDMKSLIEKMKGIGGNLIEGLKSGMIDAGNKIKDAVKGVVKKVTGWFKDLFGINSPSKVFSEMGMFLDLGLAKGIKDYSDSAYDAVKGLGDDTAEGMEKSGLSKVLTDLNKSLESDFDNEVVIRPVLDLSEIQNGKNRLSNMMSDVDSYDISGSNLIANRTRDEINRDFTKFSNNSKDGSGQGISNSEVINNTFNITGSNAKEIADEVSRVLQIQVDRRKAKWAL